MTHRDPDDPGSALPARREGVDASPVRRRVLAVRVPDVPPPRAEPLATAADPVPRPARLAGPAIALGGAAVGIASAVAGATAAAVLTTAGPWLALGAFWTVLPRMMTRRNARVLFEREPARPGMHERWLADDGLHLQGAGWRQHLPWSAMERCVETDDVLLFYFERGRAYYLPKSTLRARDLDQARTLVRRMLGARAKLIA